MKIRISIAYHTAEVTVHSEDIADGLTEDASEAEIERAVRKHLDLIISEGAWPGYTTTGVKDAIVAVRKDLDETR